jgi:hypothetical protein
MGASRRFADFCCYGRHRMIRANRDAIKEESLPDCAVSSSAPTGPARFLQKPGIHSESLGMGAIFAP